MQVHPETGSFVESHTLLTTNPCQVSTAGADRFARSYGVTCGYPITVTPKDDNSEPTHYAQEMLPWFVTTRLCGVTLPLYGEASSSGLDQRRRELC